MSQGKRKAEDLEGAPDCVCGAGPCAKHFSIKPRSKGRPFWRCPAQGAEQCSYFAWADQLPNKAPTSGQQRSAPGTGIYGTPRQASAATGQSGDGSQPGPTQSAAGAAGSWEHSEGQAGSQKQALPPPSCQCGEPATERVSWTTKNPERKFYKCSQAKGEGCNYFAWADELGKAAASGGVPSSSPLGSPAASQQGSAGSSGLTVLCDCGIQCRRLQSHSAANPDRWFYKCSKPQGQQCKKFVWEDQHVSSPSVQATSRGTPATSGLPAGPNPYGSPIGIAPGSSVPKPQSSFDSPPGPGGGGAPTGNCFKCGQSGHWAKDCPQQSGAGRGSGGRGSGRGGRGPQPCFKCGEIGHWARDCPQRSKV